MSEDRPDGRDAFGEFLPPAAPTSVPPPGGGTQSVPAPQGSIVPPAPDPSVQPAGTAAPGWKPVTGILAVIGGFGATAVLGAILLIAVVGFENGELNEDDIPAAANIAALVLQNVVLIGAALGAAALVARPRPWHFGWRPVNRVWPAVGWSALLYVSFVLVAAVWLVAIGQSDERDTIAQDLGADESLTAAIVIAALVTIGAPIVEELLFRGLLFGSLRSRLSVIPAAAITGVMFGLAHVAGSPIAFLLPLAFLGFGLCLLYHQTGSLYPPMAVHAVNNSVAITSALEWDPALIPVVVLASLAVIALTAAVVRALTGPVPADAPAP